MTVQLSMFAGAGAQFFDNNGVPLAGGLIYSYVAGTTTPLATYTTNTGLIAHSNPIVLDSAGRVPGGEIWLTSGSTYKFVLNTSASVLIATYDNIFADNAATILRTDLANTSDPTKGDALVGFRQSNNAGNLTGAVGRTVHQKLQEYISVKDFGATGDGSTNDTVAIQAAIDAVGANNGGVLWFPPGTYMIARNVGTNDHWGIKVPYSNVTLVGGQGATLKRFNSDISTYALAYPLLFLGAPDSNSTPVSMITVDGLLFEGNNVNHGNSGSSEGDNRYAIVFKNTSSTLIKDCKFFELDSGAIWYQRPVEYDYTNNVYYNTTTNFISAIDSCAFYTVPHAVPGRALVHAINLSGIDNCRMVNNYFSWCDDCLSGETTYDGPLSSGTYTPTVSGWTLGAVRRSGRDWVFSNNNCYNSSEHAVYPGGVDVVISNNTFHSDVPAITNGVDPVKIRSRNCSVTGNTITGYGAGVTVNEPSFNVSVSGNTIVISGAALAGGAIDVNSDGLVSYITNRAPYFANFYPMWNISITGNTILFEPQSTAFFSMVGIRIYTDDYDGTNYPNGQIQGVTISGNTISNYKYGVYVINSQAKNIVVDGNSFFPKPFTSSGFTTGTTMNTEAVLVTLQSGAGDTLTSFRELRFDNNMVWGAKYLISTQNGGGTAGTIDAPWGMTGNKLNYIQYIKTADIQAFNSYNAFSKNVGLYFLDRTWNGAGLDNSLSDGTTSNSAFRYTFQYDSGANKMRFYTDDSGTFIQFP